MLSEVRRRIGKVRQYLKAARQTRVNADVVSNENALNVVNAVRGAPGFGENSALYRAMGYVPKNERKSGLVRPSSIPATTTVPTLKAA